MKQLREALNYTSQKTGFSSSLIEKDYYCSLILKLLYEEENVKKEMSEEKLRVILEQQFRIY